MGSRVEKFGLSVGLAPALTKLDPQIWDIYDDCIPENVSDLGWLRAFWPYGQTDRSFQTILVQSTANAARPLIAPSFRYEEPPSLPAPKPLLQHTVMTLIDHHACIPPPTPSHSEMVSCAHSAQRSRGCAHSRFICLTPTQMCSESLGAM